MSRQLEEVASNSDEDSEGSDDAEHSGAKDSSLNTALHDFDDEELEEYSVKALTAEIASLEEQVNQLKSNINMAAIQEYRKKEKLYRQKVLETDEAKKIREEIHREVEHFRKLRLNSFMEGFGAISMKLKEMYQMITLGGDAEVSITSTRKYC